MCLFIFTFVIAQCSFVCSAELIKDFKRNHGRGNYLTNATTNSIDPFQQHQTRVTLVAFSLSHFLLVCSEMFATKNPVNQAPITTTNSYFGTMTLFPVYRCQGFNVKISLSLRFDDKYIKESNFLTLLRYNLLQNTFIRVY